MKILYSALCVMFCLLSLANAQPQLSVTIHIPSISVDASGMTYAPMPLPVRATIHNTGSTASGTLSARISFTDDLKLDSTEAGAIIKLPVPNSVPAQDSAHVEWLLQHAPSFSTKNYRIRIWLLVSPVDSFETQKLLILPAMSPPEFRFTLGPTPQLQVRPDSLGYMQNPFSIDVRIANQGGTPIETVSLQMLLPPDYILDPDTQKNPYNVPVTLPPPTAGNPRVEVNWRIRYYGATIHPRTDTLRIVARGRDITGAWHEKDSIIILQVDGLSPAISATLPGIAALEYDAVSIYKPSPYRLTLGIQNIGEQWAQIQHVKATLSGEGVSLLDAALKPVLTSLLPGNLVSLHWDAAVERRSSPRQFTCTVELTDLDGRIHVVSNAVQVPGKAYHLMVEQFTTPDTLAVNAEGTDFISPVLAVNYRLANRTWYNSNLQYIKVQSQGSGIKAPPFHEHQPGLALAPDQASAMFNDDFSIEGQLSDRLLTFSVTATSDRGDTARAIRQVFVPGLRPVLDLQRRGVDELRYDRVNDYVPNPFFQEYVLRNDGHVAVRVDSFRLSYGSDGLTAAEPSVRTVGWMLHPGDTLAMRWNFLAEKRDIDRDIRIQLEAWTSGEQHESLEHLLHIPGLYPLPELVHDGDDTLSYDPVSTYSPNPFTRVLTVRNIGTDVLRCDSISISYSDDRVIALDPLLWSDGAVLEPDSALIVSWRFEAVERDVSVLLPMTATLYHATGSTQAAARVFIPALHPGLDVTFSGDGFLSLDTGTVYAPNPFVKTVTITNNGTGSLRVDSIRLKSNDPHLTFDEARIQPVHATLMPGQSSSTSWHGRSGPRYLTGTALLEFDIHHSGGEILPVATDINIPGRANSFDVTGVKLPARLHVAADGTGYEEQGFALRFRAFNNCWARSVFTHATVQLNIDDGIRRVSGSGLFSPNESMAANDSSGILIDSFIVEARSHERFLTFDITVFDGFMRSGSAGATIFLPPIAVTTIPSPAHTQRFRIAAMYPVPLNSSENARLTIHISGASAGMLTLDVFDVLGRLVHEHRQYTFEGESGFSLHPGALPPGVYVLRAMNGTAQHTSMLHVR
jgi:hypothetical protein